MITIPNIDSKIWNIEDKTAEIIFSMLHDPAVNISLNFEGPCAETLGLYSLLDKLCTKFNYNKNSITIDTCNQIETHSDYRIKKIPPLYISETQKFVKDNQQYFLEKTFNSEFKHFGLFIGRSNCLRLYMAASLFGQYHDQTVLTFHYDCKKTYHGDHLKFDELLKIPHTDQDLDRVLHLIKSSPIKLDAVEESYPMLSPAHLNISKTYHTFFVEIVCETYFTGNSFYPTEKIWRPITLKTPFIIQGSSNYYNNLRRIGFRTFHQWWDEGFGKDPYDCQPNAVLAIIKQLSLMSTSELQSMYEDMRPTLEHNYNVFMELEPKQFTELFDAK
jgi:hypothetical protein